MNSATVFSLGCFRRGPFERPPVDATPRAQEPAGEASGPPPDSQATPELPRPSFEKPSRYNFGMRGHKSKAERTQDDDEDALD